MTRKETPVRAERARLTRPRTMPKTSDLSVTFLLRSRVNMAQDAGAVALFPGDVLILPAHSTAVLEPAGRGEIVVAYINAEFLRQLSSWLPSSPRILDLIDTPTAPLPPAGPIIISASTTTHELFETLIEAHADGKKCLSLLNWVFRVSHVIEEPAEPQRQRLSRTRQELESIRILIDENIDHPWNLNLMSRHAGLSRSQLTRLFLRHLGTTPAEYVRHRRAQHLAELLRTTDLSIATAAAEVGWKHPSQATRAFHQFYGVTPNTYRTSR